MNTTRVETNYGVRMKVDNGVITYNCIPQRCPPRDICEHACSMSRTAFYLSTLYLAIFDISHSVPTTIEYGIYQLKQRTLLTMSNSTHDLSL